MVWVYWNVKQAEFNAFICVKLVKIFFLIMRYEGHAPYRPTISSITVGRFLYLCRMHQFSLPLFNFIGQTWNSVWVLTILWFSGYVKLWDCFINIIITLCKKSWSDFNNLKASYFFIDKTTKYLVMLWFIKILKLFHLLAITVHRIVYIYT